MIIYNSTSREKLFDKFIYVTNKYSFTRDYTGKKKNFIQAIHFLRNFSQEFGRNEICIERKFSILDRILKSKRKWEIENAFHRINPIISSNCVSSRKFANGYPFSPSIVAPINRGGTMRITTTFRKPIKCYAYIFHDLSLHSNESSCDNRKPREPRTTRLDLLRAQITFFLPFLSFYDPNLFILI